MIFFQKGKAIILEGFDGVLVLKLNLIRVRIKADAFYSHYKFKAIRQYKNKCMVA
jgi:hypothetical protein